MPSEVASAAATLDDAWMSHRREATVARVRRMAVVEDGSVEACARSFPEGVARNAVVSEGVSDV